jgi:hypothetical protein
MADEEYQDDGFADEPELGADLVEEEEEDGDAELATGSRALAFLTPHHPEIRLDYIEEVQQKLPLKNYPPTLGADPNHKSVPYLTPYEKAKLIGFRANQLSQGARLLITLERAREAVEA